MLRPEHRRMPTHILLIVVLALVVYLLFAVIRPDKF